ncbi:MAG: FKBP-type peptidyl-prolyl cis-trans isomerase [Mucilaginibacter sp.]
MKKYLLLFSVIVLGLSACKKGDVTAEQASIDDRKIQAFIAANYKTTTFTKDPSGLYYSVVKLGTGAYPTASSVIQVQATGKFLNGGLFFETSGSITSALSGYIKGWQIGLLHINAGTLGVAGTAGRIMLIIPSALAYGSTGSGNVPANSVLFYTVDMIGVGN